MSFEQSGEQKKILDQVIADLEKQLETRQLKLVKLYEGDSIKNKTQSIEELDLREQIQDLDDALLNAYNDRKSNQEEKMGERVKKITEMLRKMEKP